MESQALKKYSPLGLLALAIVALSGSAFAKDAGYDVISYLYCESEDAFSQDFVLVKDGGGFQVLRYEPDNSVIIQRGKPTSLKFFTRQKIENAEATTTRYSWKEKDKTFVLKRGDGKLRVSQPVRQEKYGTTEFTVGGDFSFDCDFGEDGKRMVWGAVDYLYEKNKPKF